MNYKELAKKLPKEVTQQYSPGIKLVNSYVDSLQKQGLLPKRFLQVEAQPKASDYTFDPLVEVAKEWQNRTHTSDLVSNHWMI